MVEQTTNNTFRVSEPNILYKDKLIADFTELIVWYLVVLGMLKMDVLFCNNDYRVDF